MRWTQEMQSHCFAFQASSLRFGLQCWWFCGLGLIGQLELQRRLDSAMWAFFLRSSGAEMSTLLVLLCYVSLPAVESSSHVGCTLMTAAVAHSLFLRSESLWFNMRECFLDEGWIKRLIPLCPINMKLSSTAS